MPAVQQQAGNGSYSWCQQAMVVRVVMVMLLMQVGACVTHLLCGMQHAAECLQ